MSASNILLSLRAKGIGGLTERVYTIASRFGPNERQMERCLNHYADITAEFGARPSLPITACVLARHPSMIQRLVNRGVEFPIHGLVHNDHASLTLEEQRESITKAVGIFRDAGVPFSGFRGPYLRYNAATDRVARELGMRYHSSQAVVFKDLPVDLEHSTRTGIYHRALKLYNAEDASRTVVRPRNEEGLVKIPVAIPDDEIMVDRLHLDKATQASIWLAILEATYTRGELFTVQLHPERIQHSAYALRSILREARLRGPKVWIATLDEIATWWIDRKQTVLSVREVAADRYAIALEGSPEATLLVRGVPDVRSSPWYGSDAVTEERDFEMRSDVKPVVGVSLRSPKAVLEFLREEGFPTEVSNDRHRFGAYLDLPDEEVNEVALLVELGNAPGPLVRLWRWPNAARSAMTVTGDIDSITLQDFALRLWETRKQPRLAGAKPPESQQVRV